jgi:hypothetical protein
MRQPVKFEVLLIYIDVLDGNIFLPDREGKNVVRGNFSVVVLPKVKIIQVVEVKIGTWILFWKIKNFGLSFKPPVSESIGQVTMQPKLLVEVCIRAEVEAHP